ncbi:hypothetical protein PABG_05918 [Paracoccidioides brasiliensis Pb03]|nr:hypothetical protein PABG_05918 [Paracoccidioides brasiliensis Pb03]
MHSLSSIQSARSSPITLWTVFFRSLRLDSIIVETLEEQLYSSNIGSRTWAKVQKLVIDLDKKLNQWRHNLPAGLLGLATRFQPVPTPSKRMDEDAASCCLSAARNLIMLLHLNIHRPSLNMSTSWWCVLHYIVQAGTILIMELSMDYLHTPNATEDLITESSSVLQWIQALPVTSIPARPAYINSSRLLSLALVKIGKERPPIVMRFMVKDTSVVPSADHNTFPHPT